MIARLRAFLDRPLRDADRPRMFAFAVVLVLAGAALLALLDEPPASPDHAPARATSDPAPQPSLPEPPPSPSASHPEAPSEEGKPPAALAVTQAQVAAAKRAGRRFLTGYIPYLYGRRDARRIPSADRQLRARLAHEHPRVPHELRRRHPRVVLLHAHGVGPRGGELVALVSDGARSYSVLLELERGPAGWRVTDVGS